MSQSIMVVGTTSNAGKSFLVTALCRLLQRSGKKVAPFKGQNMSLNAFVTNDGREIGYAQAVQAWAAKVEPDVAMNPVLLKPEGNMRSQVILDGKIAGTTTAIDYYRDYFDLGWKSITQSLDRLGENYDWIVAEGAGSPAEINLKHRDITNMRVASYLQAQTILVVDINPGGSFAHVVGTLQLLEPEERYLIKGIIFNKFRGQKSLLNAGIEWLEDYTGIPVLGVIPYDEGYFPAEDSLNILERPLRKPQKDITIGVIRLPKIANFTDFEPLASEPTVELKYLNLNASLEHLDAIILPGSKTTINDLQALNQSGMAQRIKDYAASGGVVMGVCGGWQMMGQKIMNSQGQEGSFGNYSGLGLFPLTTDFNQTKITRQREVSTIALMAGLTIKGYEIHQGISSLEDRKQFTNLFNDDQLGIVDQGQCLWGTYLHGLFDSGPWRRSWLNLLRVKRGLGTLPTGIPNYSEQREEIIDAIADLVEANVDLTSIVDLAD
jgi:adenosylcobyric acid synthase